MRGCRQPELLATPKCAGAGARAASSEIVDLNLAGTASMTRDRGDYGKLPTHLASRVTDSDEGLAALTSSPKLAHLIFTATPITDAAVETPRGLRCARLSMADRSHGAALPVALRLIPRRRRRRREARCRRDGCARRRRQLHGHERRRGRASSTCAIARSVPYIP
jgi:hypothetical protein